MTDNLDTSGLVQCPSPDQKPNESTGCWFWRDLTPFDQGFIEELFASHSIWTYRGDTQQTFKHGAFDMLASETLAKIIADCIAWRAEFSGRTAATSADCPDMGREFWHIRQEGKRSTFPFLKVILSDDGKLRFA